MAVTPCVATIRRRPAAGLRRGLRSAPTDIAGRPRGWRRVTCRATSPFCRKALAADFLRFCELNPKPCPLIGMSAPGDPRVPELGEDLDIRTDLPRYRVWRNGELVAEPDGHPRILARRSGELRHRLLVFVRGSARSAHGIELRHITRGCNVPMYRTSIATAAAGPFHGPMVVSMRPMTPANAIRAVQITTRFPSVHGAPVHIGKPELIGIKDVMQAGLRRRGAKCATTSCRCSGPAG